MKLLKEGLEKAGISPGPQQLDQLEIILNELEFWKKRGLVNAEGDNLVIRHFLDCFAAFPHFPALNGRICADLGSGAGFPGLLLAVYFPESRIDLVELKQSRAAFLENCIALLNFGDRVRCLAMDADGLTGKYDVITFRAFRPLREIKALLEKHLQTGAELIVFKGKYQKAREEMALFSAYKTELVKIDVPFLDEQRCLIKIIE